MNKLHDKLVEPWQKNRLQITTIPRRVKEKKVRRDIPIVGMYNILIFMINIFHLYLIFINP